MALVSPAVKIALECKTTMPELPRRELDDGPPLPAHGRLAHQGPRYGSIISQSGNGDGRVFQGMNEAENNMRITKVGTPDVARVSRRAVSPIVATCLYVFASIYLNTSASAGSAGP